MIATTVDGDGKGGDRAMKGVMSDVSMPVGIQDIDADF